MQTALVTGGAGGIGAATCKSLAAMGFRVCVHYHTNEAGAQALAKELCAQNGLNHLALGAELSVRGQAQALFDELGNVNILVNNAGIAQQKLFTDLTVQEWEHILAVNLTSVFNCCQLALPFMIREKQGRIINISSMWGQVGASCEVAYSASKAAVIGLTKALAKEVGPSGVRVNCIAPGVIETKMNSALSGEDIAALKTETPLGVLGEPEDIAAAVAFLAGSGGSFITGQVLGVNGGFII